MKHVVVDASVAVMWVLPEEHSAAANQLLADDVVLHAPGHWMAEVATAVWGKSAVHGLLSRAEATERLGWLRGVPVREAPLRDLLPTAVEAAFDLHTTIYDALYLALAEITTAPLVTADRKLFDKANASPRRRDFVRWIGDLSAAP